MADSETCICCGDYIPEGQMVCLKCEKTIAQNFIENLKKKEGLDLEKQICNHCGKELDVFDLQQDFTIHRKIEYGSSYDGCIVHLQLCCDCFDKTVEACKVNPITEVTV